MKILINEQSIAINQIAVQAMLGGMLLTAALISGIFFLDAFIDMTMEKPNGNLLAKFLITALLGVLMTGRFNSCERYSDSIRKHIKGQ